MSAHGLLALSQQLRSPASITDPRLLGAACLWHLIDAHPQAHKLWLSRTNLGMVCSTLGGDDIRHTSSALPSWCQDTSTPFWRCAFAVLAQADGTVPRRNRAWDGQDAFARLYHPTGYSAARFCAESWSNPHTIVLIVDLRDRTPTPSG